MRLRRLSANQPGFKNVDFREGFNIVVAERTKESTKKDSRNGLGKSTLIELIHFCLGKGTQKGQVPVVDDLKGWECSLELELFGDRVTLSRAVDDQRRVAVAGEFSSWLVAPEWDADETKFFISLAGLRDNLAIDFFGLGSEDALPKYSPTFRSLISYFSRRGKDAYSSPFEHHRKQREWDKQVNVAFLLDLSWQDAAAWQVLKDEKAVVDQLARAVKEGVLPDYPGTEGALETERVRLAEQIVRQEAELEAFRVHENYRDIEAAANDLTERMHQLATRASPTARALTCIAPPPRKKPRRRSRRRSSRLSLRRSTSISQKRSCAVSTTLPSSTGRSSRTAGSTCWGRSNGSSKSVVSATRSSNASTLSVRRTWRCCGPTGRWTSFNRSKVV
jgi:uncharacterized protein YydD (DUF2326 family)